MRNMLGLNQDLVLATTFAELWVDWQIADELSWIKVGTHKTHLVKRNHPTPPVGIKWNISEVLRMLRVQASIFGLVM